MNYAFEQNLLIPVAGVQLNAKLILPPGANAIILFAHGSGSNRLSPRNKMVADYLLQQGFGTLLIDLLTPAEDEVYINRFDIILLSLRLVRATEWLEYQLEKSYALGYFGASTGAAAALTAAAALQQIGAVVCRGGRPDLAMDILPEVHAATLFIVGSLDIHVLQLNQQALVKLNGNKKLEIVPGASHLFEEPYAIELVCATTASWFESYLLQPIRSHHF